MPGFSAQIAGPPQIGGKPGATQTTAAVCGRSDGTIS